MPAHLDVGYTLVPQIKEYYQVNNCIKYTCLPLTKQIAPTVAREFRKHCRAVTCAFQLLLSAHDACVENLSSST